MALPFILTLASIVCMLVAGLTGVAQNNLYLFQVNTTDLEIDPVTLENALGKSGLTTRSTDVKWHDASLLDTGSGSKAEGDGNGDGSGADTLTGNITAADLGLGNLYDVNLWGFCRTDQSGDRTCTKAQFNWAESALNTTNLTDAQAAAGAAGANIALPKEVTTSLDAFKAVTKWTEVVYIIAMVALGIELFFGLFTSCSRAVSCVTWLVSGVATVAVIGAASMMTAMAVLVVGAVDGTAKWYGVSAHFNASFLAIIWLAATFALAAGLFWLFTICCCKPEHRKRSEKRHVDESEKFLPTGSYQRIDDPHMSREYGYNQQYGVPRHQSSGPRSDLAYEPYSHSNV